MALSEETDVRRVVKLVGVVGLVIALVVVFLAGVVFTAATAMAYNSYSSEYRYDASVTTDQSVDELTLHLPAPVGEDGVVVDEFSVFSDGASVDSWTVDVTETEHGPMLEVHLSRVTLEDRPADRPADDGVPPGPGDLEDDEAAFPERTTGTISVHTVVESDDPVETRSPRGSEPVIAPAYNLTEVPYTGHDGWADRAESYAFDSRVMIDGMGAENASIDLVVDHTGENSWWSGGWSRNYYEGRVSAVDRSVDDDWQTVSGEFHSGEGSYPWFFR
ncbi:hypothetical protein [Natronococcus sp. A-GB7]|uniref:hypothetical protein n=1 Tax=Natronococcus sp. A-GB7 TaxID=3037649 RepID=UPI00241E8708|nr:hypothetical protein [Natronococcus sp. A-GB7]MDG5819073.1 hypothetical protein [Natronococcus sp. A-GB7]